MINELRTTIESYERGTTFFADSLTGYGPIGEVTEALDQLCKEEIIIRITDGFYCYPELLNRFGMKFQKPIINEVIWDVAQHRGVRLAPTAAYSENALMLSTQVQMRYVYLTDAESQEWKFYDTITVNLRQFTDFDVFSFRSDLMQMIVISLHHITQKWVTDMELGIIRKYLIHVTEEDFQHDLALSPEWIRNALLPMK